MADKEPRITVHGAAGGRVENSNVAGINYGGMGNKNSDKSFRNYGNMGHAVTGNPSGSVSGNVGAGQAGDIRKSEDVVDRIFGTTGKGDAESSLEQPATVLTPYFTDSTVALIVSGWGDGENETSRLEKNQKNMEEFLKNHCNVRLVRGPIDI